MRFVAPGLLACLVFAMPVSAAQAAAPAWIEAHGADGAVQLTWAAVDGATAYNVYRDDELIATLTSPSYLDQVADVGATVYRVTAVVDEAESLPATLVWGQAATAGSASAFVVPGVGTSVIGAGFNGDPCAVVHVPGGVDWECVWSLLQP